MMSIAKIKIRDLKELQVENPVKPKNSLTPLRKRKKPTSATTSKKLNNKEVKDETVINDIPTTTHAKISRKSLGKLTNKETPCNQKRIDSYFTSCPKNYDIKYPKEEPGNTFGKLNKQIATGSRNTSTNKSNKKSPRVGKARRKRLFTDAAETPAESMSALTSIKESNILKDVDYITIILDSDDESNLKIENPTPATQIALIENRPGSGPSTIGKEPLSGNDVMPSVKNASPANVSSLSFGNKMSKTSCGITTSKSTSSSNCNTILKRKPKPCPSYKIIEDTTFAVDAFQFGYIENVTHYFLTHFHADHYIGLTKAFSMPLYLSPITARLLRSFIPVQDQYINELELNQTYKINDVEVTALDANHCPGSILLMFKFLDTGKCVLHTGDFRASHEMESEPIFWNNDIHTLYLDTTYISNKYAFCTQYESIMKAQYLIEKFNEKHADKRILYICGSYIIGKERFWSALAENYELRVWAEGNRYKALKAINEERFNRLLVQDPNEANMHVIPMGKLSYLELIEYFKLYEHQFDVIFAIRPSGWEKDTKPRYGAKINLVGIEYSEHSSYEEMQRFVKFLKPKKVISTVPSGRDIMKTSKVPLNWYNYDKLKSSSNYQPSIDSFLGSTLKTNSSLRLSNVNKSRLEKIVSPLKPTESTLNDNNNNLNHNKKSYTKVRAEQAKRCTKLNSNIKKGNCLQRSRINLNDHANTPRSNANSSEYFEKSDLIITTKKQPCTPKSQEKTKTNNAAKRKALHNKKPKNNTFKSNGAVGVETPNTEIDKIETVENMLANNSIPHCSSDIAFISTLKDIPTPKNEMLSNSDFETPVSQKRITRSQNIVSNSKRGFLTPQTNSAELCSMSRAYLTRSQKNVLHISCKLSDTKDELEMCDKTIQEPDADKALKQKRILRSQSALTETSSNLSEIALESKLLTQTNQNNNTMNSKLNSIKDLNTFQRNPLFKSSTESTIDPTSADELQMKCVKRKDTKMNSPTSSEYYFNEFKFKNKLLQCKRQALSQSLKPSKRNKANIDTQNILKDILEQEEGIDRFNCSQLAGLVVETVNACNPDYSKDHIPIDLLSDADDDWI